MAGPWITGPLPTQPSTVPASWAEEISRMTDRWRNAGPDPAWQQDDESDRGEPPEELDLAALYDDLERVRIHMIHDEATNTDAYAELDTAMDRLGRAIA